MRNRRRKIAGMIAVVALLLTGCGADGEEPIQENVGTVSVVTDNSVNISDKKVYIPALWDGCLIYSMSEGNGDKKVSSICKESADREEVLWSSQEAVLDYYLPDAEGNLYVLSHEAADEGCNYFMEKWDGEGTLIYENVWKPEESLKLQFEDILQNGYITDGLVTEDGEVCMYSSLGAVIIVDAEGTLCHLIEREEGRENINGGIVAARDAGVCCYEITEKSIDFRKLDIEKGSFVDYIQVENVYDDNVSVLDENNRVYIVDGNGMWELTVQNGNTEPIIDFKGSNVPVRTMTIYAVEKSAEGVYRFLVWNGQEYEILTVDTISEIVKQKITLGISEYVFEGEEPYITDIVKAFNRSSALYEVEIKNYEDYLDLELDLLKKQGPDIFELGSAKLNSLADKGVLEDLSPYFADSEAVTENDLLPSVRETFYVQGKLLRVYYEFALGGYVLPKGVAESSALTSERLFEYGKANPESRLMIHSDPSALLWNILCYDTERFIDWEERCCYFDSEEFKTFLTDIRQLCSEDDVASDETIDFYLNRVQWLYDKRILVDEFSFGSPDRYLDYKDAYGEFAELTGRVHQSEKAHYTINPTSVLGINSGSECKEGAWAFLEFLLTQQAAEDGSSQYFPVMQKNFADLLEARYQRMKKRGQYTPDAPGYQNLVSYEYLPEYPELTEEDIEWLYYVLDNAYYDNALEEVLSILFTETSAFWSGDKSVEAVTEIIQNRVSLYLDEMT